MWLIHTVGKYRKSWNRALWISFLSTQTAIKHMPIPLSEHTARTQFWELAFFSSGCNIECFIFQRHTIYHAHILVISFHSMVLGLVGSQLLCTYFPSFSFSFLSHQAVCQVLFAYVCKVRTNYYPSFERHIIQSSRKKAAGFICMVWKESFLISTLVHSVFCSELCIRIRSKNLQSLLGEMLKTWNPTLFRVWYRTINQITATGLKFASRVLWNLAKIS